MSKTYYKNHLCATPIGGGYTLNVTQYGTEQMGEIVLITPPEANREYKKGEVFAVLESVKAVHELTMPMDGRCIEVGDYADIAHFAPLFEGVVADGMTAYEYAEWCAKMGVD